MYKENKLIENESNEIYEINKEIEEQNNAMNNIKLFDQFLENKTKTSLALYNEDKLLDRIVLKTLLKNNVYLLHVSCFSLSIYESGVTYILGVFDANKNELYTSNECGENQLEYVEKSKFFKETTKEKFFRACCELSDMLEKYMLKNKKELTSEKYQKLYNERIEHYYDEDVETELLFNPVKAYVFEHEIPSPIYSEKEWFKKMLKIYENQDKMILIRYLTGDKQEILDEYLRNEFNEITYLEKIGIWFIKYKEEKEELQRLKNNIFEGYKDEKENIILYKKIIDAIKNLEINDLELTVEYNNVKAKFLYPKSSVMNFEVFDWYGDFDVNNIKKIEDRFEYQKLKLNKDHEKYFIKYIKMIKVNDDIVYIK